MCLKRQKENTEIYMLKEGIFTCLIAILLALFSTANAKDALGKFNHNVINHSALKQEKASQLVIDPHTGCLVKINGFIEYQTRLIDPFEPIMRGIKAQHGFEMRNRRRLLIDRTEERSDQQEAEDKEGEKQEDERENQEEERDKRSERSERQIEYSSFIHPHDLEFQHLPLSIISLYLKGSIAYQQFKLFEFIRYSYSPRSPPVSI